MFFWTERVDEGKLSVFVRVRLHWGIEANVH